MSEEKNFEISEQPAAAPALPAEGGEAAQGERSRRPRRRRRSSHKGEDAAAEQTVTAVGTEAESEKPAEKPAERQPEKQQPAQPKKQKQPQTQPQPSKGRQPIPVLPREVQMPAARNAQVKNSAKPERRSEKKQAPKRECRWCGYAIQFAVTFVAVLAALAVWNLINPVA